MSDNVDPDSLVLKRLMESYLKKREVSASCISTLGFAVSVSRQQQSPPILMLGRRDVFLINSSSNLEVSVKILLLDL